MNTLNGITSVSLEEAIGMLLGILDGPFVATPKEANPSRSELDELESLIFPLWDILDEKREDAQAEYDDARLEKLSDQVISDRRAALNSCVETLRLAQLYQEDIDCELNKGEASALHPDKRNPRAGKIMLASLREWADTKYSKAVGKHWPKETAPTTTPSKEKPSGECTDPWYVEEPNDPKPEQPWYTPARFFARQLIRDDATLLTKRELLAQKVRQSLSAVGIMKRGDVKPLNPATILKAFRNVKF